MEEKDIYFCTCKCKENKRIKIVSYSAATLENKKTILNDISDCIDQMNWGNVNARKLKITIERKKVK